MKSSNFILFSETWILWCYHHPISCCGTRLGWKGYTGFTVFVLDLKGEVIDVTCASQLQLHLTEYKLNQSLESSAGSTERYSRSSRWTNNCSSSLSSSRYQEKGTDIESVWPKVEGFKLFYTLSGPLCRAKALRMKYQKKQKTPRQILKTIWLLVPRIRWIRTSPEVVSGSFLPNLKKKISRNTTVT